MKLLSIPCLLAFLLLTYWACERFGIGLVIPGLFVVLVIASCAGL